jgi:hypothetical protein
VKSLTKPGPFYEGRNAQVIPLTLALFLPILIRSTSTDGEALDDCTLNQTDLWSEDNLVVLNNFLERLKRPQKDHLTKKTLRDFNTRRERMKEEGGRFAKKVYFLPSQPTVSVRTEEDLRLFNVAEELRFMHIARLPKSAVVLPLEGTSELTLSALAELMKKGAHRATSADPQTRARMKRLSVAIETIERRRDLISLWPETDVLKGMPAYVASLRAAVNRQPEEIADQEFFGKILNRMRSENMLLLSLERRMDTDAISAVVIHDREETETFKTLAKAYGVRLHVLEPFDDNL